MPGTLPKLLLHRIRGRCQISSKEMTGSPSLMAGGAVLRLAPPTSLQTTGEEIRPPASPPPPVAISPILLFL